MKKFSFIFLVLSFPSLLFAQADNEIQVYASPTIGKGRTIFELHSNRTFRGPRTLVNPASARWTNETLEITHGFGENFEVGFYTFTAFAPGGAYHYQGNQIRPRITLPQGERALGLSLSAEFGFFRPHTDSSYAWQGELRPIADITAGNWYVSFNPNIDFDFSNGVSAGLAPQAKLQYTIGQKLGLGTEYYTQLGSFKEILPARQQEHLLGACVDLFLHPDFEFNTGYFWGLTENTPKRVFKLLLGIRVGGRRS